MLKVVVFFIYSIDNTSNEHILLKIKEIKKNIKGIILEPKGIYSTETTVSLKILLEKLNASTFGEEKRECIAYKLN